ncbi:organic solvent tolerance protein [Erythrobacter longus]|uniref:LPS-assembly protein LptD n=1 Tax=Erythrobacter longus TaxID=1044 RepID=A0A074MET2_ERYLO|nr:LPS assembly protein LptD [Erythrobacter longus]KEO91969.1 organic solvent tolerance protein [Erythrobacter longus]
MSGAFGVMLKRVQRASHIAMIAAFAVPSSLAAQESAAPKTLTQEEIDAADQQAPAANEQIEFEANEVEYNAETDVIIAKGQVILRNSRASVRADEVLWDRKSGIITASGAVRFVDKAGNQVFTETVELNDAFEAGAMDDLLIALRTGGRLAARSAERGEDGIVTLNSAAYSACPVTDEDGCARDPSWRITADRVRFDPEESRIRFDGAMLEIFGARLLPLPGLALRTDGRAESGFLVPRIRVDQVNGLELSGEYYARLADNKDLTLGTRVFTSAAPLAEAQFRHFTEKGAYQITGYATSSSRVANFGVAPTTTNEPRGHLFANGRFIFSPEWSLTGSVRIASDRTFLRRYDISRDDRLRSTINLERIDDDSYFSLAGWATQTLRIAADQGQVPLALPALDYRQIVGRDVLGGQLEVQANTLALVRDEGQDTQRAFAGAKWDLRTLTGLGQLVTFTGLVRGDVYNTNDTLSTLTAVYRGNEGWTTRGVATAAVDVEWPLVGEAFGGTQVLTPRIQLVASPPIRNLAVPNEDARAIDLEDSNLFALNRFAGYDRVEDGARVTYGMDWEVNRPGWRVKTNIGQSYRLTNEEEIFPDGTGLSDKFSDFVGRTEVRFRNFVSFTHRFRLDKDNFAIRRNEIDATVGSQRNYVELGYLRLDRNIQTVEDLQDREELRAAARFTIGRNWSVFGSGVFNLTDEEEDPVFTPDGFEPIRTRLGIAYRDDCIEFGATWRRDFITFGDAREGNSFQVFFALRNLGFR